MLQDLLVDVQIGARVGETMVIVQGAVKVMLIIGAHAAVAPVRGAVEALGVVANVLGTFAFALVTSVWTVHGGV